jgi:gas vesicle protein
MSYRRTGLIAAAFTIGVTATLFAGTAGAGSSDTSSPKDWANGVCSAVQTFGESIDSTISDLKDAASLDAAVTDAKSGLEDAVTELGDSLEELGRPSTGDGKKAQSAVADLEKQLNDAVSNIEGLLSPAPSTPQEIASTFSEIGSEIQKAVSQTKSTANTLKGLKPNGALQKAFESSPDCKSLKSSL